MPKRFAPQSPVLSARSRMPGGGAWRAWFAAIGMLSVAGISGLASAQTGKALDPADFRLNSDIEQPLPVLGQVVQSGSTDLGDYLGAKLAIEQEDYRKAAQLLASLLARNPDSIGLVAMQHGLLATEGRFDEAAPWAQRLLDQDHQDAPDARETLYFVALNKGDYAAALEHAEAWTDRGVNSVSRPLSLAWAHVGLGDTAAALDVLDAVEEGGPGNFVHPFKAVVHWIADDREAALEDYLAIASDGDQQMTLRLAELMLLAVAEAGSTDQQTALMDALDSDLLGLPSLKRIVDGMKAGDLQSFPIRTPQEAAAEVFENLATAFRQDDQGGNAALGFASAALYLQPENARARLVRGEIYAGRGLYAYAIEEYEQVEGEANHIYTADFDRAEALRDLGRTEEALALLEELAERAPERWRALELMADFLRADDRFEEAVEAYARTEERLLKQGEPDQQSWRLYFVWGIAYDQMNQWPEAEAKFNRSLELDPEQPNVLNYLAYSWVDRGFEDKFDQALDMLERAVDARPNSGFIVDSLAWVLYKLGKYEEALKHMERAVELMPADPVLNDHLGDVYWVNGRFQEADFQWRRALSFKPTDKDRARIELKLELGLDRVEAREAEEAASAAEGGSGS